jgi:hypothetical protein
VTIRDVGLAMLRRWYIVVVWVALAVVAGHLLHDGGGLYTTKTVVSFLLPEKTSLSLNSGLDDASVIAFAGAVAREVNGGRALQSYSTDDAPLYGAGVRQGVLVSLPNSGNQWSAAYQRAELVLQIVGPTEQWVAERQGELLTQIGQISGAQQASVASETSRIQVSSVPLTEQIFHIAPSRNSAIGAFLALIVAALIIGGWGAVSVDRVVRAREERTQRQVVHRVAEEGLER